MNQAEMKVTCLGHTPNPEKIVAAAARLCYSGAVDVATLLDGLTPDKAEGFVAKLEELGHESPFEHVSFTFAIEGVSRALTHQLVRHRIASFSQRSQRYLEESGFDAVVPASVAANPEALKVFEDAIGAAQEAYNKLIALGAKKEDARSVLPNAAATRIIVTMNVRSLWNFFKLRTCTRAQLEIRQMATEMLKICREISPVLFKHAGPTCETLGYCPEGKMSCGRKPTLEALLEKSKG